MGSPTSSSTVDQFRLPFWLRFFNWAGEVGSGSDVFSVDLSEETLMRWARLRTELSDWGNEAFRIPLRILIDSCEKEACLTLLGRVIAQNETWAAGELAAQTWGASIHAGAVWLGSGDGE